MIARRSLLIVISTLLSSVFALVGILAMTNYLGKDVYGNISWVLATLATLNTVSDLGFGNAHIKRISEGQDERDCFSTFIVIKVVLIALMVVFVLVVFLLWNDVLGGGMNPATWNLVVLFMLYYIMYDLSTIVTTTFTAKMETAKTQIVALIDPLVRVPLIVFIAFNHLSDYLAYAYVFASIGVLLISLFLLKRNDIKWIRPTLFRSYLKFALPLAVISIAGAVTVNLDKILIGYFDSPGNVAYFASAQTLLGTIGVIGTAVATLAFPSFSKLDSQGDTKTIRSVTFAAERYTSMIIVPIVALVVLFPTQIAVTIFGAQFSPAGETMRWLAVDVALTLLVQVYISQILGVNRPDINAKVILGSFAINVVLLFVFVPNELFGMKMLGMSYTGAAIAGTIGALVVYLWVRLIVRDLTGTGFNPRILRHLLAGVEAGLVIMMLGIVYPLTGFVSLIIFSVVTLGVFFGMMAALDEFTRKDLDYFLDLLNPSKMLGYMGGEMKGKK
jgi:O-antigen/teichoic acid export membrane protein